MKLRRSLRMFNLRRPRARQSWNKYNLYNLSKMKTNRKYLAERTFFQQKWKAKSETRAYHGEHVREGTWERMFSRRLASVVNMSPAYMARHDGSEQASGRGSGKVLPGGTHAEFDDDVASAANGRIPTDVVTPYMQMTYAPLERRLDTAIFRALFASSARQAKQMVTHGFVKVNGSSIRYPGYLLNPGDMFQVEPERVMAATGRQRGIPRPKSEGRRSKSAAPKDPAEEGAEEGEPAGDGAEGSSQKTEAAEELSEQEINKKNVESLKTLMARAKEILTLQGRDISTKRKQALRKFTREAKAALSRAGRASADAETTAIAVEELSDALSALSVSHAEKVAAEAAAASAPEPGTIESLTAHERSRFNKLLAEYEENPIDKTKPYFTPWQPRDYMRPFAFIPRYLEVNQKICSAVYLRHPVARQGQSEVPSPFPEELNQLAFNWYLRRR